jgi:hypothetical protein
MCNSIITPAPIQVQMWHEYQIQTVSRPGGDYANGVFVDPDGCWLGKVRCDAATNSEYLDLFQDDYGFTAAPDNWEALIIRAIQEVGAAAPAPAAQVA